MMRLEESDGVNTRRLIRFFILSALFFLFIFGATFIALLRWDQEIQLPNFQNQEIMEAIKKLQRLKLHPYIIVRNSKDVPAYAIIEQSPAPGTFVKAGRKIKFYVSSGEKKRNMPDFIGRDFYEVKAELLDLFSTFEWIPNIIERRKYSETLPKDRIIEQQPPAGLEINPRENLVFTVSRGIASNEILIPHYRWRSYKDVSSELEDRHIEVTYRTEEISLESNVGKIIAQSVRAGTSLKKGDKIEFLIGVTRGFEGSEREIYRVYSLKVPPRSRVEPLEEGLTNVFPLPEAEGHYSPEVLSKLRRVSLTVDDSLGREIRFDEYVYAGSFVDLPYKTKGAGTLTVYLDGQYHASLRFE